MDVTVTTADLTPALEAPSWNERPRADRERGVLMGTRCRECAAPSWPSRSVCHRCGSPELGVVAFEPTGTLLTFTTVHIPRPDLETPYTLGQVRIDSDGPVVFGHLRSLGADAKVPCPVRLALDPDPNVTPWYWFEPEGTADGWHLPVPVSPVPVGPPHRSREIT